MAIKKWWVRSTLCMNGQIGYNGRIVSRASNSKNVAFVFRSWQRLGLSRPAPVTNNVRACFPRALCASARLRCFLLTLASSSTAAIIVERISAEVGDFTSHPRWSWRQSYLYPEHLRHASSCCLQPAGAIYFMAEVPMVETFI